MMMMMMMMMMMAIDCRCRWMDTCRSMLKRMDERRKDWVWANHKDAKKLGERQHIAYPSSHNHGSGKWPPQRRLKSSSRHPFSTEPWLWENEYTKPRLCLRLMPPESLRNDEVYDEIFKLGVTLPKTNSLPLKPVVFNRDLLFQRGPPFSGAFAVSFREGSFWWWRWTEHIGSLAFAYPNSNQKKVWKAQVQPELLLLWTY